MSEKSVLYSDASIQIVRGLKKVIHSTVQAWTSEELEACVRSVKEVEGMLVQEYLKRSESLEESPSSSPEQTTSDQ